MLLESDNGAFIYENPEGSIKEYPSVEHALTWLKRKTELKEIIVDIELWNVDAMRKN
jgi:hypothetical protein